jgi:hypothetical protein
LVNVKSRIVRVLAANVVVIVVVPENAVTVGGVAGLQSVSFCAKKKKT